MRAVVNCRVCELAIALWLILVTICKSPTHPIKNPNPVSSHQTRDNIDVIQLIMQLSKWLYLF
jgi:hypothetical protein